MIKLISGYLVAGVVVHAQTLKAGIKNSLDISVLEQAKDVYFDKILELINNLSLPDLEDGKGNYLRENTFEIIGRSDRTEFVADVANNAVVLKNSKVSAKARSSKFRYKEGLLIAKGDVEADMNTVNIEAGLSFSTKTLEDGRVVPYVTSVDVKCNINRFDMGPSQNDTSTSKCTETFGPTLPLFLKCSSWVQLPVSSRTLSYLLLILEFPWLPTR